MNGGGGTFGTGSVSESAGARSLYALDVDDDGEVDVATADQTAEEVCLHVQDDMTFAKSRVDAPAIFNSAAGAGAVYAADVDGRARRPRPDERLPLVAK